MPRKRKAQTSSHFNARALTSRASRVTGDKPVAPSLSIPPWRQADTELPSAPMGAPHPLEGAAMEQPQYTGHEIEGVVLAHKQNYVPVRTKEDAKDVSDSVGNH